MCSLCKQLLPEHNKLKCELINERICVTTAATIRVWQICKQTHHRKTTTDLFADPLQAWVFISNRSDRWQEHRQQQHLPLMAQSSPGGKSSLFGRSKPAASFNRISQQKVRSTMSKLCTKGSGAGFNVSQSTGHILWRFCLLPSSSLRELIKH